MNIIFMFFYILVIIAIITNALKIVKVFKGSSNRILNNIQNMSNEVQERTKSVYKNNNSKQAETNLDEYIKLNSNPIKEKNGKRSKM